MADFIDITKNPFHKAPDPGNLFTVPQIDEALARLEHGATEREITVLTGDIGVGKTTVTRALVDRLEHEIQFVWILNPRLTPTQLLQQISSNMGITPKSRNKVDLLDAIEHAVVQAWESGRPVVFLFDEAQLMPVDTLEEVRLLTNFQLDTENLLGLILVGQPELNHRLTLPRFRPLAQRIGIRYHLNELDEIQTEQYVLSRLESAGIQTDIFEKAALSSIFKSSRGIPRIINNICANALLTAYANDLNQIGIDVLNNVILDLGLALG